MGEKISMAALILVLAANLLQSTYGTTYTVGDSSGWVIPSSNTDFYDNWADNKNFVVGDVLVFTFTTGTHNVAEVTEAAYDACNVANPISTLSSGPARITLNRTGDHYFICAFPGHCSAGQKLSVEVRNGTRNSSAPTPSPRPSPTIPGAPSPTPTTPATPSPATTPAIPSPATTPGTPTAAGPETPGATAPGPSGTPGANSASSIVATLSPFFFMSVALVLSY
ncbi:putative Early nodulin 16 [Hibiscus syriacus]|uniref:Early nodulin 16 n=1 Tax=Hibiscus syriacus TaxID=106335 RepID=A0A6A3B103_HIBSY|nr:putative Early nodulin 16 [Hibiscus syriacus]